MNYIHAFETNVDLVLLLNNLINRSFPELHATKIDIEFDDIDDALLIYGTIRGGFYIDVDPLLRNKTQPIIGGIVHELCHITQDQFFTRRQRWLNQWAYDNDKSFRDLDERNTDIETIIRGYGHELFELMKIYFDDPKVKREDYSGLTAEDIEKIQKSLN